MTTSFQAKTHPTSLFGLFKPIGSNIFEMNSYRSEKLLVSINTLAIYFFTVIVYVTDSEMNRFGRISIYNIGTNIEEMKTQNTVKT